MLDQFTLEEIDRDGAIGEAAFNTAGDTRLDFLKKSALGVGTIAGGGAILSALAPAAAMAGGAPPKAFGKGDIAILNYALTLEYLESAFYNEATAKLGGKLDARTDAFLKIVTADENAHVKALKKALGSKAVKSPKFDFKGTTADADKFKATASVLENTGVHAYLGQVGNVKNGKVLAAAGAIMTIEARHAAEINSILGKSITPDGPFDTGFTAAKVLAAVKGTGFIVG